MNERKVAIGRGGLAAKRAEICWHACGIGNQGRLRRHGAHMRPGALDLGITANAATDRRHRMLYAALPKINAREETPAS
jgi:hypothetical protein